MDAGRFDDLYYLFDHCLVVIFEYLFVSFTAWNVGVNGSSFHLQCVHKWEDEVQTSFCTAMHLGVKYLLGLGFVVK